MRRATLFLLFLGGSLALTACPPRPKLPTGPPPEYEDPPPPSWFEGGAPAIPADAAAE